MIAHQGGCNAYKASSVALWQFTLAAKAIVLILYIMSKLHLHLDMHTGDGQLKRPGFGVPAIVTVD